MKFFKLIFYCSLICLFSFVVKPPVTEKYDYVVAQDGSGNFSTIQSAIEACKAFPYDRIKIFIKNGVYHEKILVPSYNTKLSLIGESKDSVIISFDDHFTKINKGRNSTFYTATVSVKANDFHAENLTIENSAGPVGQAIALSVEADRCSFKNCKLLGNQDTLYVARERTRQYFNGCYIEGTTDFIFGEATALFEKCIINARANSFITAASTPQYVPYGFVFKNCVLQAAPGVEKVFLGRPWRRYAKTVFMHCNMGSFIQPAGWDNWKDPGNEKTVFYAEYKNTGAGSDVSNRVTWAKQLTDKEAKKYTLKNIFGDWVPE